MYVQVSLKESILQLTEYMQPSAPTEIPSITESTSTQEVMTILLGRVERLEKKSQTQDLANEMIKDAISSDSTSHDRFDELVNRIVQSERKYEKQEKRVNEFEKRLATLANSQSRSLKMINVISQKVNAISTIAWDKTTPDGSKSQSVSFNSIVDQQTPAEFVEDHALVAVEVFKEALVESEKEPLAEEGLAKLMKGKQDGPKVAMRKTMLKEAKQASLKKLEGSPEKQQSDKIAPVLVDSSTMTIPEENEYEESSQYTLDSSVMIEEFVMEKLDSLERKVNDLIGSKLNKIETTEKETAGKLEDVSESLHEVEMNVEDLKDCKKVMSKSLVVGSANPVVIKENTFRLLIRDTQAAWDLAFAELDKKVAKMNSVIEQMGNEPDDLHRRLSAFKDKVTHALEVISVALPGSREEIITTIYDTMEDVRQDALQVVVFEEEIRTFIEQKDPGMTLSVSQIPTHLPELLHDACAKTTEVLGEKIEKYDLATRIDELTALVRTKVDIPLFITLEEDLRIALTLKADQKQTDTALDKKASLVDVQKFREYVTDEIDAMRAMLATSSQRTQSYQGASASTAEFEAMAAGLTQRMDKLFKNMQETSAKIGGLVPRQEIETALQALLDEVKAVKGACVDKRALEDRLRSKADNAEVDRLLSILQGTVGDPLSTQKAAIQKCLVCDKPVNPFQQTTNRPNSPTTYFDKTSAGSPPKQQRPQTTSGLARSTSQQTYPEKMRQTAEMNILRNSMESLPALDDSRIGSNYGNNNGNGSTSSRPGSRNNNLSAHSRRIRSAAGGGLGPSYQQDTR
jgi:hypothetical protein